MSKKLPITSSKAVKISKTTKKGKSAAARIPTVSDDFKSAALVVSVLVNLFILIGWVLLQITDKYNVPVANFLFNS